jgi:hypothetical protein
VFRIGIVELGITCGLIALAILVPLIVTRGYASLSRRLKDIEEKIAKKR